MPKRLSITQIEEIIKGFVSGKSLDQLSKESGFTKLTISRKLKENLGEDEYSDLFIKTNFMKIQRRKIANLKKVREIKIKIKY